MKISFTKYLGIAAMALFLCGKAMAGSTASLGYSHYNFDEGVELGAVYGSFGYQIPLSDAVSFTPEARLGTGVDSDRVFFGDVEIDVLYGVAGRVNLHANDSLRFFGSLSYIGYKLGFSGDSDTTWEVGFGAGLDFNITDGIGLELMYENVDSVDVASLALRFRF